MPTPRALRPFSTPQYRILTIALLMSLLGAGVWLVAVVWQVIALGGGPADLSLVATGASVGLVGAVLIGGVAADRIPQKRILVTVEAVKAVAIGTAAALTFTGSVDIWHLAAVGFVLGACDGFFYPAYSALLPAVLPADELLAANGIEGMLRPTVMQAAGPALSSAVIAAASPAVAMAIVAVAQLLAVTGLAILRTTPVRREMDESAHPIRAVLVDLKDGFSYMARTPWLLGTLLYATLLILLIMGPIEVLLPFAVKDQTGGGAGAFALAIGAFGIGGAVGSLLVASLPLPRRYLTLMVLLWGVGSAPLVVIGLTDRLAVMVVALFVVGVAWAAAQVIWGTLLQRRVPSAMLGRVSSLDFFVSLALMPVSMALAGPVGERIGLAPAFLVAGAVPTLLAVITVFAARMPRDEIEHPLATASVEPAATAQ
ncbi:MAG TPA: MFS transporter [Propionibacteriaceae bacterium]|nr:MFS transporter [Propionibacteriaceae bacterium]